jgi:hypothetical protein
MAARRTVMLAERFKQVEAVDVSGAMIELARKRRPQPNVGPGLMSPTGRRTCSRSAARAGTTSS